MVPQKVCVCVHVCARTQKCTNCMHPKMYKLHAHAPVKHAACISSETFELSYLRSCIICGNFLLDGLFSASDF